MEKTVTDISPSLIGHLQPPQSNIKQAAELAMGEDCVQWTKSVAPNNIKTWSLHDVNLAQDLLAPTWWPPVRVCLVFNCDSDQTKQPIKKVMALFIPSRTLKSQESTSWAKAVLMLSVYLKGPGEQKGRWKKVKARFITTKDEIKSPKSEKSKQEKGG